MRSVSGRWIKGAALLVAALSVVLGLPLFGCQPEVEEPPGPRVLFIGVDGLDWGRVQRLADEGRLPNIAGLMEEGSSGVLHSLYPYLSPSIWTSIATGKREDKHGIAGFLVDRGTTTNPTPTSSNMRTARAMWQILNDAGHSTGVIGWLVTWPAEPVSGYMISSRFHTLLRDKLLDVGDEEMLARKRQSVHPPGIWDDAVSLRVDDADVSDETVAAFLGGDLPQSEEAAAAVREFRRIYASDQTTLAMAHRFFGDVPTDLAAVYFRGLDTSCHMYWRYMEPDTWPEELQPEMVSAFAPLIENYYERIDGIVGEVLAHRSAQTTVVLCSDHGFAGHSGYPGFEGELAVGVSMHREDGIVIIAGPGVAQGTRIDGASILDVAPTVLATLDIPLGEDMDGQLLDAAFEPGWLEQHPVSFIETHETGERNGDSEPIPSPVDEEVIERLKTLGYIS